MKLSLQDPKYLKESVSIISELVTEGIFKVTPDYIELVAMDPANVAMVVFKLMGSTFEEYDVKKPENLGINLTNFKQILRRAKSNDKVILEVEASKLKITFQGKSKRTFHMPLIELEDKSQKVPELNFKATITSSCSTLSEAVDDVDIVGESVTFMSDSKTFSISASGDLTKARIDIPADDSTKITTQEPVKSKYSIEYLKKMIQGSKLSDMVTIEFSKDYPLKMQFVEKDAVQLAFILAPRVDND
jgi:proliferating cell nuclear antigen